MRRFRFSIAGMLGLITFAGVAFAALSRPSDAWDAALLGLAILAVLTAILLAVHGRGPRRAYWLGFALFGTAYLALSLIPPVASRLPSTKALDALGSLLARPDVDWADDLVITNVRSFDVWAGPVGDVPIPAPPARGSGVARLSTQPASKENSYIKRLVGLPYAPPATFSRIGHSLLALIFAALGGFLSRRLHRGDAGGMALDPTRRRDDG